VLMSCATLSRLSVGSPNWTCQICELRPENYCFREPFDGGGSPFSAGVYKVASK